MRAVRDLVAALRLRRLRRRAAVPRARGRGARALLAPERGVRGRAGLVRALVRVQARAAPAARARRPRRPPPGRLVRADRLQDRQGQDRGRAARGRPAVALPDGRARVVAAGDLGAELLLRADRREGPGRALGRGARPGARDGRRRSPAESSSSASSRPPRPRSAASATTGSSARRPRSRRFRALHRGHRCRMAIGTSLFLIAVGAILRYAVDATVAGLDIQTAGLILMIIGVVGLVIGLFLLHAGARRPDSRRRPPATGS